MRGIKKWLAAVAALGFFGGSGSALAVGSVFSSSGFDASVAPGGLALPGVTLEIGPSYDLMSVQLAIDYDNTKLSFNAVLSTIQFGASAPSSIGSFMTSVFDLPTITNDVLGGQYFTAGVNHLPVTVFGPIVIKGVFTPLPGFTAGSNTLVTFSGLLESPAASVAPLFEVEAFIHTVTVTVVPEPESWAMLVAGLGLIGAMARRRARSRA